MNPKLITGLVLAVTVAIVALSISSVYSAYVASTNHHNSCLSRDKVVDAIEGLVAYALTPKPGTTVSAAQVKTSQAFERASNEILDKARC
jgi:hypothetical protein